jgi:cystathionine gamma-synthase
MRAGATAGRYLTGVGTASVKGGEPARGVGHMKSSDAIVVPIVQTAAYTFENSQQLIDFNEGRYASFEYGRYGNPTVRAVEQKMMELEGAEDSLASASGMYTAISMMMALLPEGGRIITTTDCYRRTRQFLNTVINKMGVQNVVISPGDMDALKREVTKGAHMFFSESPSNPMLRCVDIPAAAEICRGSGTILCIDGTFSTPYNQRPLELGADLVIHSATKYLAGHHDVIAGVLSGRAEMVQTVRDLHGVLGGVLDPHAAYLLLRGLKTLHLRLARQNSTADALARVLHAHPKVCAMRARAPSMFGSTSRRFTPWLMRPWSRA